MHYVLTASDALRIKLDRERDKGGAGTPVMTTVDYGRRYSRRANVDSPSSSAMTPALYLMLLLLRLELLVPPAQRVSPLWPNYEYLV